ncbi:hypothetical protein [Sphingopyxis sp. JAI128]|uniref:hypothetical protein n=1 Tax=Sphingopyxis sp. JAI128 TaxID=2723066 RepID=UPI0016141A20|nr:hypothetical protein [Sphingopyxis sp. JAI128]MBB6424916.1 cell pole-organizing protein PopZ [Sphingopyxis sp. JAI128]
MGDEERLCPADALAKDIGRKCSDDVGAAIRRNMALMTDQRGAFLVAAYGAATAIGSATGAFSNLADDIPTPDERMIDEMWRDFLRPLAIGQLLNNKDEDNG